ncbi:B12-binding domain-containing radical SAM protein [Geotalea uraniireducens]|uniref:B12-binding domain-containing radical SAM protein n=1 Tax=Geotalea uraniireducens TaxID=351604 RepID=UPI0002F9A1F5|nr:radical SAM protein [Geotalea uraniireducens]
MKILLVQPRAHKIPKGQGARFNIPPWSLCAIAGLTPEKHEIEIIDELHDDINFDEKNLGLVGITAATAAVKRGYEIADEFRKRGVKVVMGGIHVTAMPEEALEHCDAVAIGEAELIWEKILEDAENNCLKPTYKADVYFDMKNMKKPRFDLINHRERYLCYQFVQTTRGCPFNCEFCSATKFWGNKYRYRPIDEVIEELKTFDRTQRVFIVDDHIGANPAHAKELFDKLTPLKMSWASQTGVKTALREGFLKHAAESGCKHLFIGFESINEESLKNSNKKQNDPKEFKKIVEEAHKYGILIQGAFVIGLDDDKADIFKRLHRFVEEMKFDHIQFNVPYPYPGTALQERLIKENRITSFDYDNYVYDGINFIPKNMTQEELHKGYRWLYQKNSSIWILFKRSMRKVLRGQFLLAILALFINLGTRRGYLFMKKCGNEYNPIKYPDTTA